MASVAKIVDKMKRQPASISPAEAEKVLLDKGYRFRNQTGSHQNYKNDITGHLQTIPKCNPVKEIYVKQILTAVGED